MHTQQNSSIPIGDWHTADIGAALKKRGWNYASLSTHHNMSRNALRNAVDRDYPRAEGLIAEAIGVPPQQIWPTRYAKRQAKAQARKNSAA